MELTRATLVQWNIPGTSSRATLYFQVCTEQKDTAEAGRSGTRDILYDEEKTKDKQSAKADLIFILEPGQK